MAPSETIYPITASPEYSNTAEAQENDSKSNHMKMIEAFKEEMNKPLKEIQENAIKQVKMNKTVQDLNMERESMKKAKN